MTPQNNKGVLLIVENLPVPLDRRVWTEATTLARAGWPVAVISPRSEAFPLAYEWLEGVHVYRHPLPFEARGVAGFILEYTTALWWELRLAWRIHKKHGFAVVQICNPPDLLFLVAGVFKGLFGVRVVFDHHDPFPELFAVKFPRFTWLHGLTRLAERLTFRLADRVVTTSEALRQLAITRGRVPPDRISLVRSGVDLSRIRPAESNPALKEGRPYLVLYLGIIGSQDGVDHLLEAARHIVHDLGRRDVLFLVVGDGPALPELRALAHTLNLEEQVRFTGYLTGTALQQALATADIGVCPDPWNDFNDKLSMNKVLEYMVMGVPVVMYPLSENKLLADEAAELAQANDPVDMGRRINALLDDPERRRRMAAQGRERVTAFSWQKQVDAYLQVFSDLTGHQPSREQ